MQTVRLIYLLNSNLVPSFPGPLFLPLSRSRVGEGERPYERHWRNQWKANTRTTTPAMISSSGYRYCEFSFWNDSLEEVIFALCMLHHLPTSFFFLKELLMFYNWFFRAPGFLSLEDAWGKLHTIKLLSTELQIYTKLLPMQYNLCHPTREI